MKKELSVYHLVVATVFAGLLLTFAIFYVINMTVDGEDALAPACYDGTVIGEEDPVSAFDRAVYQNADQLSLIHELQYQLFGIVDHPLVVAGEKDFLFESVDDETGYDYLADYTGNLHFSGAEMDAICTELQKRQKMYAERGCEYYLVILPNAQTVYSEYMPAYYGTISDDTRLARLEHYLAQNGFAGVIDVKQDLLDAKEDGWLYNNTENSLNALGLYHTYRALYRCFSAEVTDSTEMLERDELEFYYHETTGKSIAQKAGLSDVVKNRTVSLSNSTRLNYRFINNGGVATTIKLPFYVSSEGSGSPELLLQFSDAWERLQIEPFFSNTFSKVTYQVGLEDDAEIFAAAAPKVVFQFVYENELSLLLPKERFDNIPQNGMKITQKGDRYGTLVRHGMACL